MMLGNGILIEPESLELTVAALNISDGVLPRSPAHDWAILELDASVRPSQQSHVLLAQ